MSNYFEKFYDDWHQNAQENRIHEIRDRDLMVLNYLKGCDSVFELGVGNGVILKMSDAANKAGIDVSKEAIKISEKSINEVYTKSVDLKVLNIDDDELPWESRSFDGAMAIEVLEHLFDPVHALSEMNRILKPNGRLAITVPNIGYYFFRWYHLKSGEMSDFHGNGMIVNEHIRFYGIKSLKILLEAGGFEIVSIKGCMKKIVSPQGANSDPLNSSSLKTKDVLRHLKPSLTNIFSKFNWLFKLWKIWPSMFAVGLVVEAIKITESKYKYNTAIDHQNRSSDEVNGNINSIN